MTKTIRVATEVGTFKRRTARTYEFIVVAKGLRHELLEASRLAHLASARKELVRYTEQRAEARPSGAARVWDLECHARYVADGSYVRWAADARHQIAQLEAQGPITKDDGDEFVLIGWCGRFDLAVKTADNQLASRYRDVRIFYVSDGRQVAYCPPMRVAQGGGR